MLDVSEGYPVDGRIFEVPEVNRDKEQPRYVGFIGSMIEPAVASDRPWTRGGGMEVGSPCLRYVKNFLLKGRIVPVLKDTHDWITEDYWVNATGRDASYFLRPIPRGYQAPIAPNNMPTPIKNMYGKVAYPGEQINKIIDGAANIVHGTAIRRGVVELKSLAGHPYNPQQLSDGLVADPGIWQIQRSIFPHFPLILNEEGEPTVLLDEIEEILISAQSHSLLRPTIDEYLMSLNQFRDFAKGSVEQTHYIMRESGANSQTGYIPRYTALDFILLEQLGMERQDINIRKTGVVKSAPSPELGALSDLVRQFVEISLEEKKAIMEQKALGVDVNTPSVDVNTMAAAPIAEEPEDEPMEVIGEGHVCACGKSFNKAQGLKVHQDRFCELNKSEGA